MTHFSTLKLAAMTVLRARESGWGAFSASVSENRLLASLRSRLREMERSKAGAESDEPAELVQVRALVWRRFGEVDGCYLREAGLGAEVGGCPAWSRPGYVAAGAAGGASW